ncbi:MAG: DsbA family oxidoreductase [Nitrospira sp.]|jgi:predicted DsbA family dithiol-disulfide isomerase|nr:MAG: DsbA family oxidoreductase [Nitrospira sp.]
MQIDIYSDIVCPWCYVGKRRLERALTSVGSDVHVTWRPFQLNPTMLLDGMDRTTYLNAKFGSLEAFGRMEEQLLAAGADEQIPFAFEKIQLTPNTFAAHRLVWYVAQSGKQDEVVEALFRAYFLDGKNIGDLKVLTQVAVEAELDRAETEEFLASDKGTVEVKGEEAVGRLLGIRGVPYFVFNGSLSISGAQPSDIFVSAIREAGETATEGKGGV